MYIYQYVPAVAALIYISLLFVVIFSRPWSRQHKFFMIYLVASILWSLSDFVMRSPYFENQKLFFFRLVTTFTLLWGTQLFYFVRSFFHLPGGFGVKFGYSATALFALLCAIGLIPPGVNLEGGIVTPVYGLWMVLYIGPLLVLSIIGMSFFFKKLRAQNNPEERNKIGYLITASIFLIAFGFVSVTPLSKGLPLSHVGSCLSAVILAYAVASQDLVSIGLMLRRALGWMSVFVIGVTAYILLLVLGHFALGLEYHGDLLIFMAISGIISFAIVLASRPIFLKKIEQLFYRKGYEARKELMEFVSHKMLGVLNLQELGEGFLTPLTRTLDCQEAYILLPDREHANYIVRFSESAKNKIIAPLRFRNDSPIISTLGKQYITKKDLDLLPELRGMWSLERTTLNNANIELIFPLMNQGNMVGIMALGRKNQGKYTIEDANLVESLANQVAVSLEKEGYHSELAKREKELSIINRLTNILNSSLKIQDVYETFIEALKEVINVDFAIIGLVENTSLNLVALYNKYRFPINLGDTVNLKKSGLEWVVLSKNSLISSNPVEDDKTSFITKLTDFGLISKIFVPLIHKDETMGILALGSLGKNTYSGEQTQFIEQIASQISTAVVNSQLYASAETRSRIDELTGLFNRRHFDESVEKEIRRDFRYGNSFSLFMMDVDHFKVYNDSMGHVSGDRLLKNIAHLIRKSTREIDVSFRYGGDEFAVILPNTTIEHALIVAERVRIEIMNEMQAKNAWITVSIGLSSWPSDGIIPQDLITAADRALYYAKNTGANRSCIAAQILPSSDLSNAQKTTNDEKQTLSTIYALAATIEARDRYTYGHSNKVRLYAVALAETLKLSQERVTVISHAALLHDIGKIGIYDTILNKPEALNSDERELIKKHPQLSRDIVAHIPNLTPCLPAILHHHERWDGKGYPHGLQAENIPLEARILTIADSFDAMISARPYRDPLPTCKVIEQLQLCSGTQFDPHLIKLFLPLAIKALDSKQVPL
jgi:diguanylate cyclase (GGDEF)-like protein